MIITNLARNAFVIGEKIILPGANVIEGALNFKNPILASLIEKGVLEVEEKITAAVAKKAINKANTQKVVDEILKVAPKTDSSVKSAGAKKKREIDDFDAEVKNELEKQKVEATV